VIRFARRLRLHQQEATMNNRTPLPLAAALALFAALPAAAQDYGAMIQQQMAAMNANIARGQQMVNGMVRQRMADPQVQAGYQQYLAQMRAAGRPPMDYPTYTYNWIYTAGFSAQGIAHARANEAGIARAEQGKVQELRAAEAQRGQAQQASALIYPGRGICVHSSSICSMASMRAMTISSATVFRPPSGMITSA